jgi:hypothetical protein
MSFCLPPSLSLREKEGGKEKLSDRKVKGEKEKGQRDRKR